MATYFANVTLFDGRTVRGDAGVLVSNGTVAWVGPHSRAPHEAAGAVEVDGISKMLTPGLIDAHVHLCFDGSPDVVAEARELTEGRAAVKAVRNAIRSLRNGVTTVRDLGGPGRSMCDVARAIEDGVMVGPRVVASGQALTITGGHGDGLFARACDGPVALRPAVRDQMKAGARSIKVIATGGVVTPNIPVDFTAFTLEELQAAVDEAHSWGRPIAAHAHGAGGIENAVQAGVDSIEHGSQITAEVAKLMKEQGTFHVPTISALTEIAGHPDEIPAYAVDKARQMVEFARAAFRRSVRTGVRIACGSDAGMPFTPHGTAPHEIVRMVEWGLSPVRALQAATSNAAALLRVPSIGTVEEGKAADLVLYDGSPLDEIEVLLKPAMVMKAGDVVVGER